MNHRLILLAAAVLLVLGGCSTQTTVKGKVIQGNLSFIGIVDEHDARLSGAGLENAEVEARADVGSVGGNVFATGKSRELGLFSLTFKEQTALSKPVQFSASLPGYVPAKETISLPPMDKRVLIILKKNESPPRR